LQFFSPGDSFFFIMILLASPLTTIVLGTSYLPLQPTYYPSFHQPTYLLHATHLHCQSLRTRENFSSSKL
jgi:hypothetical protein